MSDRFFRGWGGSVLSAALSSSMIGSALGVLVDTEGGAALLTVPGWFCVLGAGGMRLGPGRDGFVHVPAWPVSREQASAAYEHCYPGALGQLGIPVSAGTQPQAWANWLTTTSVKFGKAGWRRQCRQTACRCGLTMASASWVCRQSLVGVRGWHRRGVGCGRCVRSEGPRGAGQSTRRVGSGSAAGCGDGVSTLQPR